MLERRTYEERFVKRCGIETRVFNGDTGSSNSIRSSGNIKRGQR